jgi:aspartyl protease family protein
MRTEIIAAITVAAGAAMLVRFIEHAPLKAPEPAAPEAQYAQDREASIPTVAPAYSGWGREVRVKASRDHQFYIDADINRRGARFLVDTGASFVALRASDASAAGIHTTHADYTYPVRTANGETKAALVTIDEIDIEGLRIDGVKAFVLPDEQLGVNLLGMSFLSRLESVEARGGEMILKG